MIIQTPTPNLEGSLSFYGKLGFSVESSDEGHFVSDGKCVIEINPEKWIRPGVKLFKSSWEEQVAELRTLTQVVEKGGGYLLGDGSGTWILLIEGEPPTAPTEPADTPIIGGTYGLTIEAIDLAQASKVWTALGFSKAEDPSGYDMEIMVDANGNAVTLMPPFGCEHLFFTPSLSYFNGGKNLEIIEELRRREIPLAEEITVFNEEGIVDNVILKDPGGLGFFVFNDEV